MKIFGKTHIGLVRETNQDAYATGEFSNGDCWAVVCDGMGGVSGGQVASRLCVEKIAQSIERGYREKMTVSTAKNLLNSAISVANTAVFKQAQESPELKGMGTTVVAVMVLGNIAVVAHVGDSRAYLLTGFNIKPVTKDHSYVQLLVDTGKITPEMAKVHPDRNIITRAVGIEHVVDAEIDIVDVNNGDSLLICTDGLNGYVDDVDIFRIVNNYGDSSTEKLVETANDAGGHDNVTVVIMTAQSQGE